MTTIRSMFNQCRTVCFIEKITLRISEESMIYASETEKNERNKEIRSKRDQHKWSVSIKDKSIKCSMRTTNAFWKHV